MSITQQILYLVSALGAFNGLLLSLYLFLNKKRRSIPAFFLSLLPGYQFAYNQFRIFLFQSRAASRLPALRLVGLFSYWPRPVPFSKSISIKYYAGAGFMENALGHTGRRFTIGERAGAFYKCRCVLPSCYNRYHLCTMGRLPAGVWLVA